MASGVNEGEQSEEVRKVIRDSRKPDRPPPEPRIVECAKCGGGATVFFKPRPGQRILCENCMRAEKEKAKVAKYEMSPRRQASGVRNQAQQPPAPSSKPKPTPAPPPIDAGEPVSRTSGEEVSLGDLFTKAKGEAPKAEREQPKRKDEPPPKPKRPREDTGTGTLPWDA